MDRIIKLFFVFFFNDTATTEIYTLSLHDALPILVGADVLGADGITRLGGALRILFLRHRSLIGRVQNQSGDDAAHQRSEEHTSELQSRQYLVCRLLLEKKKNTIIFVLTPQLNITL